MFSDLSKDEQYDRMANEPVNKLILSLSIPTIISMLVTNIYNMADTYFVSTISTSASGATGVVFGLMAMLQAFGFMFGHGAGSNISRLMGAKNYKRARNFSSDSFWLSISFGVLFLIFGIIFTDPLMRLLGSTGTILPYARVYAFYILLAAPAMTSSCVMNNILRYEGQAFYAMIGLTSGGILNIFGDYILIKIFHMGIAGAGISTCLTQYISFFILMIPFFRGKTQSSLSVKYFLPSPKMILNIVLTGFPSFLRQGLNSASTMVINNIAGIYGDTAIAAISIVNRICLFLNCVTIGIGQGFQPVSAFNFGARKYSRVKKGYYYSLKSALILMVIFGLISYFFANDLVRFFRDDPEVIKIGSVMMRIQCISIILSPFAVFSDMMFQSIGKKFTAMFLASLRRGLVLIPAVLILSHLFGLTGLECSQGVSDVLASLICYPFSLHFFKTMPGDGE